MAGLALAGLTLAACGSVRLPQSPLLARLERKSGLIAFIGLDGNIYTMNQAGENMVAITEDAATGQQGDDSQAYFYPVWAPDGKRLAYVGFHRSAGGPVGATLYTIGSDGADRASVFTSTQDAPFYLYWNPTSDHVSFLSSTGQANGMQLQLVSADGDDEAVVVERAQPFYWAWAPDGQSFVAHTGGPAQVNPEGASLWRYNVDTHEMEHLALAPSFFQAPVVSPDGDYFAAAIVDRNGDNALVISDAAATSHRVVTQLLNRVAFDWAPEGDRLAYITGQSTSVGVIGPLTIVNVRDIDAPEIVATDAEEAIAFFWSPDGDRLAYFTPALIESEDGGNTLVLRVSVMNARNGESELLATIRPPESFITQILPFYDQYQRSATIWSPDARNLVINAMTGDNRPGIFILPADGSLEPRFVEFGTMAFWSWK